MVLPSILLVVFAVLSYAVDIGMLPYDYFRPLLNFIMLGFGLFMLIRIKGKENQGFLEHLEMQISDLYNRIERKQSDQVWRKLDALEERVKKVEGRL
ncbi:MAG: hypothetical protein JNL74_08915 [Fibrobacteres bacterium]|nr:hypothetical protein [Fibrobacterota bacterium]